MAISGAIRRGAPRAALGAIRRVATVGRVGAPRAALGAIRRAPAIGRVGAPRAALGAIRRAPAIGRVGAPRAAVGAIRHAAAPRPVAGYSSSSSINEYEKLRKEAEALKLEHEKLLEVHSKHAAVLQTSINTARDTVRSLARTTVGTELALVSLALGGVYLFWHEKPDTAQTTAEAAMKAAEAANTTAQAAKMAAEAMASAVTMAEARTAAADQAAKTAAAAKVV